MTLAVDFHTGLADPLGFACRLVRKAWRSGKRVVVTGVPEQLDTLDTLLWTFESTEFVPHARLRAGQSIAPALSRTPIWLADAPSDALADIALAGTAPKDTALNVTALNVTAPDDSKPTDVLVNLGPGVAPDAGRFERLIEIVGDAGDALSSGRQRWRSHAAAGRAPVNHKQAVG